MAGMLVVWVAAMLPSVEVLASLAVSEGTPTTEAMGVLPATAPIRPLLTRTSCA